MICSYLFGRGTSMHDFLGLILISTDKGHLYGHQILNEKQSIIRLTENKLTNNNNNKSQYLYIRTKPKKNKTINKLSNQKEHGKNSVNYHVRVHIWIHTYINMYMCHIYIFHTESERIN